MGKLNIELFILLPLISYCCDINTLVNFIANNNCFANVIHDHYEWLLENDIKWYLHVVMPVAAKNLLVPSQF